MKFTKENIRYCLLSWNAYTHEHILHHANKDIAITGLYQWAKTFNGAYDFPQREEDWKKYNLVHLNITDRNFQIIPKIKAEIPPDTKLLVNVDHSIEMWTKTYKFPWHFLKTINEADYIFAVEPTMARILEMSLNRPIACIPHPCDLEGIKSFRSKERQRRILVSVHRYDLNYMLPWFAINNATSGIAKDMYKTTAIGAHFASGEAISLYHELAPHLEFKELLALMADSWCCLESYTIRSYGRVTIECAALGVPVIGWKGVASQEYLFPELCIDHNDWPHASTLLSMLFDPEWHAQQAIYALDRVHEYSRESCADKMITFLNQES